MVVVGQDLRTSRL